MSNQPDCIVQGDAMTATSDYLNRPLRSLAEVLAERERLRAAVARSEEP